MYISEEGIVIFFTLLSVLVYSLIGSAINHYKIKWFHQSAAAVLIGIIFSAVLHYGFHINVKISKELQFYFFLPIIVFSEGYNLEKHLFFNKIPLIVLYGIIGTIFFFGILTYFFTLISDIFNTQEIY